MLKQNRSLMLMDWPALSAQSVQEQGDDGDPTAASSVKEFFARLHSRLAQRQSNRLYSVR